MFEYFRRLLPGSGRKLSFYGRTDTGLVRSHNEDAFAILKELQVYLVADGMGGHQAGEVASRQAIEALVEFLADQPLRRNRGSHEKHRRFLLEGFNHANRLVMKKAAGDRELRGMGCTLVAGLIDRKTLHTCHVGDTRCYVANQRGLSLITADHTLAAARPAAPQGEGRAPERHVLTMAVGFPFPEEPEYHAVPFNRGDKLLLCSDGLWSMVDDRLIYGILQEASSPEAACDRLVQAANEAGGRDNITVLVVFG